METKREDKLAYIIAVVNEFADAYALNSQQAYRYLDRFKGIDFVNDFYDVEHTQSFADVVSEYRYLDRFKGIDFVNDFYDVEHTQSFADVVSDLAIYCRKNGGALI